MYEVYTLQEVVNEIKDEKARLFMENLPYDMKVNSAFSIDKKDQTTVDNFAKDTGDYKGLSEVDRMVIALGVTISRQKNEI
jgi:rRNA maturation endonuclease Nob1